MNELKEILKTVRFERFIVRESALHEMDIEEMLLEPVYNNDDVSSELKNLSNVTAKELAEIAIFG